MTVATLCLSLGAATAEDDTRAVVVQFAATVGDQPFACGETYEGIGTVDASMRPQNLTAYVSELALIDAAGATVEVELDNDFLWQHDGVALLDFEDASGQCNGNAPTNTTVRGRAPSGDYRGLSFTLGVPERLNHADATLAPAPLNYTGLFWSWRTGYIFFRLEVDTERPGGGMAHDDAASGFNIHLGSVGCGDTAQNMRPPEVPCRMPNRPRYVIDAFDVDADTVVFDIGRLLAETDVTVNAPGTASGCMSAPDDADCVAIMPKLGLAAGDAADRRDTFVSARPRSAVAALD